MRRKRRLLQRAEIADKALNDEQRDKFIQIEKFLGQLPLFEGR